MPYIKQQERDQLDPYINQILTKGLNIGELNYIITRICHSWLSNNGVNYANLNSVHGVLDCANKELYRVVTGPYEDKKISENGPVSELDSNPKKDL